MLITRIEIDVIFQITFDKFFNNIGPSGSKQPIAKGQVPFHIQKANGHMNGVITELLDPNLFYSRLTFLDSDKEAFDIKEKLQMGKRIGFQAYKLPNISEKYYTMSSRIKHQLQASNEGRVRARYSDDIHYLKASLQDQVNKLRKKTCSNCRDDGSFGKNIH